MELEIAPGIVAYINNKGIVQIRHSIKNHEIHDIKNYGVDGFFELFDFPKQYQYSSYFKTRFYQLSKLGVIRPEGLASDLRSLASGKSANMEANRGVLRCLAKQGINVGHDHVDSRVEGWIFNLNNHLKQEKIKDFEGLPNEVVSFKPTTGHWVIYHEHDDTKLYLDICEHGDDGYLVSVGAQEYRKEYPETFQG